MTEEKLLPPKREQVAFQIEQLRAQGLKISYIADQLGVTRGYLSKIYNKHIEPPDSFLYKFEKAFKSSFDQKASENSDTAKKSVSLRTPPPFLNNSIKFYNIDVIDRHINIWNDPHETHVTDRFVIPSFSDCDYAINISGQDMEPVFCHGDVILCNTVKDMDLINFGDPHLIITNEVTVVKYVFPGSLPETIMLKSANTDYPNWEIIKDKVNHLYRVKGILRRRTM